MKQHTAVIIDDVEIARDALRADIQAYLPEIEIVGEADGVLSGAKVIREKKPTIVYLDIHLTDGDGFDLLQILEDRTLKVIFTTASDAHAIRAFRISAVDYLLKPIDHEELITATRKAIEDMGQVQVSPTLIKENLQQPSTLVLHTSEQIKVCPIETIVRLEAMGNYTYFYFQDGSKLLVTKTLKDYNTILEDLPFLRVHQSHLIHLNHLKSYIKTEGGYLLMNDDSRIPVSVRKKSQVMEALDKLGR